MVWLEVSNRLAAIGKAFKKKTFLFPSFHSYFRGRFGGMAERLNAAVLKTVEAKVSGGSNPSPSVEVILVREAQL